MNDGNMTRMGASEAVIPPRFHAIWVGPRPLPDGFERVKRTWLSMHPGWEFRLWRDADLRWLRNQVLFDSAPSLAQKADIARYEILHQHGGVYVDVDMECLKSIEPLLQGTRFLAGRQERHSVAIGLIGAVPGHPLLRAVINRIQVAPLLRRDILNQTGPGLFTRVIEDGGWTECPGVKICEPEVFYPVSYANRDVEERDLSRAYTHHAWSHSWKDAEPLRPGLKTMKPLVNAGLRQALGDVRDEGRAALRDGTRNGVVYPVKRAAKKALAYAVQRWPVQTRAVYWGGGRVLVGLSTGGRLLVPTSDLSIAPEIVLRGGYEPAFTEFLEAHLRPGMTFVDVGANIGLFTVIAAHIVGPSGRVVSYECGPRALELLRTNVELNWISDRTTIVPVAVSDSHSTATLIVPVGHLGLGSLGASRTVISSADTEEYEVSTEPLTDRLKGLSYVDMIKIDVEGSELEVLRGAWPLFESRSVGMLSLEFRWDVLPQSRLESTADLLRRLEREFRCRFFDPERGRFISLDDVLSVAMFSQLVIQFPSPDRGGHR